MGLNENGKLRLVEGSNQKDLLGDSSGNIEIKSIEEGDGSVIAETLTFDPVYFDDAIAEGTYTGIEPTGGNGTGLIVTVVVSTDELDQLTIASVTVTSGGTGYQADDIVSIATSEFGATSPAGETYQTTSTSLKATDLNLTKEKSISVTPTSISITGLPTSNPLVAGQLWDDRGTLKISIDLG